MKSDTVRKGTQQAPHRSLFNALGMTQEEMDRPFTEDFFWENCKCCKARRCNGWRHTGCISGDRSM